MALLSQYISYESDGVSVFGKYVTIAPSAKPQLYRHCEESKMMKQSRQSGIHSL